MTRAGRADCGFARGPEVRPSVGRLWFCAESGRFDGETCGGDSTDLACRTGSDGGFCGLCAAGTRICCPHRGHAICRALLLIRNFALQPGHSTIGSLTVFGTPKVTAIKPTRETARIVARSRRGKYIIRAGPHTVCQASPRRDYLNRVESCFMSATCVAIHCRLNPVPLQKMGVLGESFRLSASTKKPKMDPWASVRWNRRERI